MKIEDEIVKVKTELDSKEKKYDEIENSTQNFICLACNQYFDEQIICPNNRNHGIILDVSFAKEKYKDEEITPLNKKLNLLQKKLNNELETEEKSKIPDVIPKDSIFFMDQFDKPFVRFKRDGHCETHAVNSKSFRRIIVAWLLDIGDFKPRSEKIKDIISLCEGLAYRNKTSYHLYTRVAKTDDGSIFLDLCDSNWSAIQINKSGWKRVEEPPIIFRRYTSHMREIGVDSNGTKEEFETFINSLSLKTEEDRHLIKIFLATTLIPGIPKPILIPKGDEGSGKTNLCKALRRVTDNSEILVLSLPTKQEELAQQLQKHYFPIYDNAHMLSQWQSDMLCRACTGEGISKRELYSDDNDVIFKYMRAMMINGINCPGTEPDFLDRSILIGLERIPEYMRKREEVIVALQEQLSPKVLGYLLNVIVKALNIKDTLPDDKHSRMADFEYYGEAISRALGYHENEFYQVYATNRKERINEAIENDLVATAILLMFEAIENEEPIPEQEIIAEGTSWYGTPSELFEKLKGIAERNSMLKDTQFPKSANALTRRLNRLKTVLMEHGINFSKTKSGIRKVFLHKAPRISPILSLSPNNEGKKMDDGMGDTLKLTDNTAQDTAQ